MNNNYRGYKQEIERILGKEWGDDTPRVIFPTRKERKSPFGVEGSLHYDIHPHWHRELDDNDNVIESMLDNIVVSFYGDLRGYSAEGLILWFGQVVDEAGKMPLEIRNGVLNYRAVDEEEISRCSEWSLCEKH